MLPRRDEGRRSTACGRAADVRDDASIAARPAVGDRVDALWNVEVLHEGDATPAVARRDDRDQERRR